MVLKLKEAGYFVIVFDNLSTGHADAGLLGDVFVQGDLGAREDLYPIFQAYSKTHKHPIQAVMHFAGYIQVGESVLDPAKYYQNNVAKTLVLLDLMREFEVKTFIFSSTAAIFGEPQYVPIDEVHPKNPVNPYGRSKWMVEQILEDYDRAYGLKSICLRYFNACGADPLGRTGEWHEPETHLIPLVLQVASGRRPTLQIFGRDYPTPDGTCVRDYVHVLDLCQAHLKALECLLEGGESAQYNLGNNHWFSVQEVAWMAEKVTRQDIPIFFAPRRPGDPARLIAKSDKAKWLLGWRPEYTDLREIITHAWAWEQRLCKKLNS
jgi:UDP-glucose 4-epimerase